MNKLKSITFDHLNIYSGDPPSSVGELLERLSATGKSCNVGYINSYGLWLKKTDRDFADALPVQDICFCDGVGASLYFWACTGIWLKKTSPADFFKLYLEKLSGLSSSVYIFGHSSQELQQINDKIAQQYPSIQLVGSQNGFDYDLESVVVDIKAAQPDVLLIALGMPLQEKILAKFDKQLQVPAKIAIGGTLLYVLGMRARVPGYLNHIGLEWLWRWCHEPLRLTKRYVYGNSYVLVASTCQFFKRLWRLPGSGK